MHAQGDRQLDIGSAAGTCDEDEVIAVFRFGEDLMQVGAEHGGVDNGKVDAWGEGDGAGFFFQMISIQACLFQAGVRQPGTGV